MTRRLVLLIGFIKTSNFGCNNCSRLRLTSTGEFKICLYQSNGLSVKNLLRNGTDDFILRDIMKKEIDQKHGIGFDSWSKPSIYMSCVGG